MTEEQTPIKFEQALEELETLVSSMEGGNLSLEDSLAAFERGIKLSRDCQRYLKEAELRVQVLTEEGELAPLDAVAASEQ